MTRGFSLGQAFGGILEEGEIKSGEGKTYFLLFYSENEQ